MLYERLQIGLAHATKTDCINQSRGWVGWFELKYRSTLDDIKSSATVILHKTSLEVVCSNKIEECAKGKIETFEDLNEYWAQYGFWYI